MEEKQKKKGLLPIVIILVVIIVLLVGYIILVQPSTKEKPTEKENTPTEKETKEEEEKRLTESEVKDYLTIAETFTFEYATEYPLEVKDLSNQSILNFAWREIYDVTGKALDDGFSKNDLDKVLTHFFGKDYQYTPESIDCFAGDGILFQYEEATGNYERVGTHGHGGGTMNRAKLFFSDAIEKGDTLTLKVKVLYGDSCGDTCGPITDYYATPTFEKSIYKVKEECYSSEVECDSYEKVYPHVESELPTTNFIFQKQSDGNYGLSKVEME